MDLIILDLDETLVHATEEPLEHSPAFMVEPYAVYLRPRLDDFLRAVAELATVAVWTSSSEEYATDVVANLPFASKPEFLWGRTRCTRVFDPEMQDHYFVKDLKKVRRRGYDLDRVLIVDDTPRKLQRNFGNHVRVAEFLGDPGDTELVLLAKYLRSISDCESLRSLEKRNWRIEARGA